MSGEMRAALDSKDDGLSRNIERVEENLTAKSRRRIVHTVSIINLFKFKINPLN